METLEINVTDEIAPLLERMAAHNKGFLKSAAKSLGYFAQKEIKEEVRDKNQDCMPLRYCLNA